MKYTCILLFFVFCLGPLALAQNNTSYWQQHVSYTMNVDMNVTTYTYTGTQELVYTNNSPDTLQRVFYHLFFNAFQPESEMDVRSRTVFDPDKRVKSRIQLLQPNEIGYLKVENVAQDGKALSPITTGTILEVPLVQPLFPGTKTTLTLNFSGQVPKQIRRSGRQNAEGVELSMTQWYPKLAEYDFEGWHPNPYIGREFHGVWGDFDVTLNIDADYMVGGSGYLQNADEIGKGYSEEKVKNKAKLNTWHFIAPQVHDFAWAADPDFIHDTQQVPNGPLLHFFYKDDKHLKDKWKKLQPVSVELMHYFSEVIGPYPYKQYSIIQGGDGGMEYAMATLITGDRKFGSLVGVTAHEMAHSWFQHILATNESTNEWMDEGFTSYISALAMAKVQGYKKNNPHEEAYSNYFKLASSGGEHPQTTHADRYSTNFAYGSSAYAKGQVFLSQLEYIIGEENVKKTLKRYFSEWKFKHPTPTNFIRIAEKISGIQLGWYLTDWTRTINTIDYGIRSVEDTEGKTAITLRRFGLMPMPIDLEIKFKDGSIKKYYIPLRMMYGSKPLSQDTVQKEAWAWAYPTYRLILDTAVDTIDIITIDPTKKMADLHRENNTYPM